MLTNPVHLSVALGWQISEFAALSLPSLGSTQAEYQQELQKIISLKSFNQICNKMQFNQLHNFPSYVDFQISI